MHVWSTLSTSSSSTNSIPSCDNLANETRISQLAKMSSPSSVRQYTPASAYVVQVITGDDATDDVTVSMRYHGRLFIVDLSLSHFHNSPTATDRYLSYIAALLPDNCGQFDDITDTQASEWLANIFQPIFDQLAPDVLPYSDPDNISAGSARPVLSDYFFPETFGCRLEADNEEFIPVHVDNKSSLVRPLTWLDEDLLDELENWTRFFEPSELEVAWRQPEQTLYAMPEHVHADLDSSGHKTLCFFKHFGLGSDKSMSQEISVHKKVHDAQLGPDVRVTRLQGIVHLQDEDASLGLLLSLVDHEDGGTLQSALFGNPPQSLRARWAKQVAGTVEELHKAGAVWGDVKAENVLIDKDGNACVIDFEGGYTEGCVDKDIAGTIEGDLQGLGKILDLIRKAPTSKPDLATE